VCGGFDVPVSERLLLSVFVKRVLSCLLLLLVGKVEYVERLWSQNLSVTSVFPGR
jgi:hypothetical protein